MTAVDRSEEHADDRSEDGSEDRSVELLVLGLVGLLVLAVLPNVSRYFWSPKTALVLVLLALGVVPLVRLVRAGARDAQAGAVFVGVVVLSGVLAVSPRQSIVGRFAESSGVLYTAALVGVWAIARTLPGRTRRPTEVLLIALGLANASLAIVQVVFDIPIEGIGELISGRPQGTVGNPVFLGGLLAGVTALVAARARRGSWWWIGAVALATCGVQVAGSRIALLATVAALAWACWRTPWLRVVAVVIAAVVGVTVGSFLLDDASATNRAASDPAGFSVRLHMWRIGGEALLDRPVLGWGPGLFRDATSPKVDVETARLLGSSRYADAHNVVVEYAATTGILGLGALAVWLVLAARRARGPLAAFALFAGITLLAEPQSVALVPLIVFALGLAAPREPDPDTLRPGRAGVGISAVLVVLALAAGGVLVVGDGALRTAIIGNSVPAAERAASLLAPWSDGLTELARNEGVRAEEEQSAEAREASKRAARRATRRDPRDPEAWLVLGLVERYFGTPIEAQRAFVEAERLRPWSEANLFPLYEMALDEGRTADARRWRAKLCALGPASCPRPVRPG